MALNTAADVIVDARKALQDTTAPYRWSDDTLLQGVYLGFEEVQIYRPDLFLETTPPLSVVLNTPLDTLDRRYRRALTLFVCYHAEAQDLEAADVGRAILWHGAFTKLIMGT